jgi:hypothetical protein
MYMEGFYCLECPQACSLSSKPGTITGECRDRSAYKRHFAVENVLPSDSHRHVWFLAACDRDWLDSHVAPPVVTCGQEAAWLVRVNQHVHRYLHVLERG